MYFPLGENATQATPYLCSCSSATCRRSDTSQTRTAGMWPLWGTTLLIKNTQHQANMESFFKRNILIKKGSLLIPNNLKKLIQLIAELYEQTDLIQINCCDPRFNQISPQQTASLQTCLIPVGLHPLSSDSQAQFLTFLAHWLSFYFIGFYFRHRQSWSSTMGPLPAPGFHDAAF